MNKPPRWSLPVGKIAGIKIYIHWTFFLLVIYIIVNNRMIGLSYLEILYAIAFVFTVFLCVTLHELGHALTARRYGCTTRDIILLPIGGLARMNKLPEKPAQEMAVAFAGPVVNLIIALLLYFAYIYPGVIPPYYEMEKITGDSFMLNLFLANAILAIFNLIPAFPMDGGRILRAFLSRKYDKYTATRRAALVGQVIAVLFIFFGLFNNPVLVFVGLFIFIGAQLETEYYESRHLLRNFTVRDAVIRDFKTVAPTQKVSEVADLLLETQATVFLVDDSRQPAGSLNRKGIINALKEKGPGEIVENVMKKEIHTVDIDTSLDDVYEQMLVSGTDLMVVTEDNMMCGILDMENVIEFILIKKALAEIPPVSRS